MSREVHVRFCEGRGVRLPPATRLLWNPRHLTNNPAGGSGVRGHALRKGATFNRADAEEGRRGNKRRRAHDAANGFLSQSLTLSINRNHDAGRGRIMPDMGPLRDRRENRLLWPLDAYG